MNSLDIRPTASPLSWHIGPGCFGPAPELRRLDDIRKSLRDPHCSGPEVVYAICMDVGRDEDRADLLARHLLFGVVTYAAGRLGNEPIRSQGHVHKRSPRNGWSTPEVYEIWTGRAIILMHETDTDDPGRCFAIEAGPGEVVIVPPGWAHATISADPNQPLSFGAWCDRAYGFDYTGVRTHGGLAWFSTLDAAGAVHWSHNPRYAYRELIRKSPRVYREFCLEPGVPIYEQYRRDRSRFDFVPDPQNRELAWRDFVP
jgi:glucose-6-phosphate isomerase, archaeal